MSDRQTITTLLNNYAEGFDVLALTDRHPGPRETAVLLRRLIPAAQAEVIRSETYRRRAVSLLCQLRRVLPGRRAVLDIIRRANIADSRAVLLQDALDRLTAVNAAQAAELRRLRCEK